MQGSFSPDSLEQYKNLLSDRIGEDFSEIHDFTRCVRPDGSAFGTSGKCTPPNIQADPLKLKAEAKQAEEHAAGLMRGGRRHSRTIQGIARRLREEARKKREQAG